MLLFIVDILFYEWFGGVFFCQFLAEVFAEPFLSCIQYNEDKTLAHHEKYFFREPFNSAGEENSVLRFQTDG